MPGTYSVSTTMGKIFFSELTVLAREAFDPLPLPSSLNPLPEKAWNVLSPAAVPCGILADGGGVEG